MDYAFIRSSLAQLRRSRTIDEVFGANGHRFALNPVLPESEVVRFENKHGISLPPDYRGFLTHLGNGGAGPFYGVFKLGEMDDNHGHAPWDDLFVGPLMEPFPFTEAWNDLTGQPDPDGPEDEYEQQLDLFEKRYFRLIEGGFPICHIGCAKRIWLVVTGPEAGNVWQEDRAENGGVYPLLDAEARRLTFGA